MDATPFSARHSQPTLSALVDPQPHLYHPCNFFPFFSEEEPINFEAWLTSYKTTTTQEGKPSESASCQLQHRTKEQVKQSVI
jgi:hypothetical protein